MDKDHLSGKVPDGEKTEQDKWKINHGGDGEGSDKIPDAVKLLQIFGKGANGFRPHLHAQSEHSLEKGGGNDQICLFPRLINEVPAQPAHHQFKKIDNHDARGKNPQCFIGSVIDNLVVHIQYVEGGGQAKEIDKK